MIDKLYGYIFGAVLVLAAGYFLIVKPRIDLKDARAEIVKKDKKIVTVKHDGKKEVFETKYREKKEGIKPKGGKHEDLNLSIGFHTIIFDSK